MSKKNRNKAVSVETEAVQATTENVENNVEAVVTQTPVAVEARVIKTPQEVLATLATKVRNVGTHKQHVNAQAMKYMFTREQGASKEEVFNLLMDMKASDLVDINAQARIIDAKHVKTQINGFLRNVQNQMRGWPSKEFEGVETLANGNLKLKARVPLSQPV